MQTEHAPFDPSPEQLALITEIATRLAASRRMSRDDALDFAQQVQLTFLKTRYAPLRAFGGRSSLRTYLTTVIRRLLVDDRRGELGRWRPSTEARRAGNIAIELERLVLRDGCSKGEAVEIVAQRPNAPGRHALWSQLARLPLQTSRRPARVPLSRCQPSVPFADPLSIHDAQVERQRATGAVARAIRQLPLADRTLILQRYMQGRRVRTVASRLGEEPKVIYRRYERILDQLRVAVGAGRAPLSKASIRRRVSVY